MKTTLLFLSVFLSVSLFGQNDLDYYNNGVNHYEAGEYEEAIIDFTNAIKINPENVDAYRKRGISFDELSKYKEAIADYTSAIEIKPNDAIAYRMRGQAQLNKCGWNGNMDIYDSAIDDYTSAIKINADYTTYHYRGFAYHMSARYKEAIADFTSAIKINPDDTILNLYFHRGYAFLLSGNHLKAIEDFTNAIELNSNHTDAYCQRGVAKEKIGLDGSGDFKKACDLGFKLCFCSNSPKEQKPNE